MPSPATSTRLRAFGTTIFAEMTALANKHNAVNLSQGFPDEDGPQILLDEACRAMKEYDNQYAPLPGTPDLREAISLWWGGAQKEAARLNPSPCLSPDPDTEITVTAGCTEAIASTVLGLLDPGDEIILFEPFYDSYRACVALAGARPRFVQINRSATPENGQGRYAFDPDRLTDTFTDRTRAILVNTPHNPTGTVFSLDELQLIADLCIKHDAIAITDEVYERLTFNPERPHLSIASFQGMRERTVTLSSLGKTFSLTGWKIGWAIAPPHLTAGVRAAHQFLTFAVARPLQHAAALALTSPEAHAWLDAHRATLITRRDYLCDSLARLGFEPSIPDAGYFVMARYSDLDPHFVARNDAEFVRKMTAEARVAGIPPSAFCIDSELCRDTVRFAFSKNESVLREAVSRLENWLSGAIAPKVCVPPVIG